MDDDYRQWRWREKKRKLKEEIDNLRKEVEKLEDAATKRKEKLEQKFNNAMTYGNIAEIELLMQIVEEVDLNDFLISAIRNRKAEIVQVFLEDRRIDPTDNDSKVIRTAVAYGEPEIVSLLARIPKVVTGAIDHYLKIRKPTKRLRKINRLAYMTGAIPRSEMDPSISDEDLLVWAAAMGSLALVRHLIYEGVDPSFSNNSALAAAIQYGH